jgi:hypothetical protein
MGRQQQVDSTASSFGPAVCGTSMVVALSSIGSLVLSHFILRIDSLVSRQTGCHGAGVPKSCAGLKSAYNGAKQWTYRRTMDLG